MCTVLGSRYRFASLSTLLENRVYREPYKDHLPIERRIQTIYFEQLLDLERPGSRASTTVSRA